MALKNVSKDEMLNDRKNLHDKLVERVYKQKSLLPESRTGLPIMTTMDGMVRHSVNNVNVLRYVTGIEEDMPHYNEYVRIDDSMDLTKDAKPIYFEEWYRQPDNSYRASLVPYYNIGYVKNADKEKFTFESSDIKEISEYDKQYHDDFFHTFIYPKIMDTAPSASESLDETQMRDSDSKIKYQIGLKLSHDLYQTSENMNHDKMIFFENELDMIRKNPQILFD